MEKDLQQNPTHLIKVVLFGPESTGKSTLAADLAAHYNTIWIPEFARNYLQEKWDKHKEICTPEDLMPIALGQMRSENEGYSKANKIIFLDTDCLVTATYSLLYYGFVEEELARAARENTYHLYLLTQVDIPWEADDLRDRPEKRSETFDFFKEQLELNQKNYFVIEGNRVERLEKAVAVINSILN
ncbi:MAG: AAA family ATPase [Luteibaculaceae bacterium]